MSFAIVAGVGAAVSAGLGIAKAIKGGADKRAAKIANEAAKVEMDKTMDKFRNMDTSNPYLNLENTMEDLTVNTQAAEFVAEQNQIGMADTLGKMNQAAGGSGIAALAQAMANQNQIASQKASISIAEQEKANQVAERQEAGNIQNLERQGEIQSRNLKQKVAGMELRLAAGDVAGTAADINAAQRDIESGIDTAATAAGTYLGGIG
jgi:hypothetical protein|tara:strand:- start:1226 stop:1846 length:621 start_codon:yes stop_codon:yes gene_type:complete